MAVSPPRPGWGLSLDNVTAGSRLAPCSIPWCPRRRPQIVTETPRSGGWSHVSTETEINSPSPSPQSPICRHSRPLTCWTDQRGFGGVAGTQATFGGAAAVSSERLRSGSGGQASEGRWAGVCATLRPRSPDSCGTETVAARLMWDPPVSPAKRALGPAGVGDTVDDAPEGDWRLGFLLGFLGASAPRSLHPASWVSLRRGRPGSGDRGGQDSRGPASRALWSAEESCGYMLMGERGRYPGSPRPQGGEGRNRRGTSRGGGLRA